MNALEQQLARAGADAPSLAGEHAPIDPSRLDENLLAVQIELDAAPEPRLARVLRRLGVPDLAIPLVTATPAMRRSWFVAVAVALLFALSATSNQTGEGADRILIFLTLAPLIPLAGVALAFGPAVDPTHDLVLAAPRDTFAVFLIRAVTVLGFSSIALLLASILLPSGGLYRVAWLLPSLALTALTMAVSTRREPRRVAAALGVGWIMLVIIISQAISAAAMFGPATQIVSVVAGLGAAAVVLDQRGRFDSQASGS